MAPRTSEQFEAIRNNKRKLILDAALHVFSEEGYHSASIAKVSKEAGISKGLMYNYFESKQDLLHELLNEIILKETEVMQFLTEQKFTVDSLIQMVEHTCQLLKADPKHWKLYFLVAIQTDVMNTIMQEHGPIYVKFNAKILTYFTEKGHEKPMEIVHYFGATLSGIKMNYILDPENFPLDAIKKQFIHQFIDPHYESN